MREVNNVEAGKYAGTAGGEGVRTTARGLFAAMRPRQWVKNLLVVAPLVFSRSLFERESLGHAVLAFALFCLVSSAGYLFNDITDLERDRAHPFKRLRPLAAGRVGTRTAAVVAALLAAAGLGGALLLGRGFALALGAYAAVSLSYTLLLKRLVILDVFAVAAGFVLRATAGALVIGVEVSGWLLVCTTLLALLVGFGKRRHELILLGEGAGGHRRVLEQYDRHFLDMMMAVSAGSAVMSYALYTESAETVERFGTRWLFATFPFVLYGVFRYLHLLYTGSRGGDPVETLLNDAPSLANALLWAATAVTVLYFR